jgi:MIP family channel proteins
VPGYIAAQVLGAFVAGALIYLNYKHAINSFEAANDITRGEESSIPTFSIFATFPAEYYSNAAGPFLDELIGTALLVGIVLALVDQFNMAPRANMAPLIIGFVVFAIGMSFGANSGYAINPARDLGPRLFAWIQGWGEIAVPGDYGNVNSYMWIPIVAPLVGGLVGAVVHNFFIHHVLLARAPRRRPPNTRRRRCRRARNPSSDPAPTGASGHRRSAVKNRINASDAVVRESPERVLAATPASLARFAILKHARCAGIPANRTSGSPRRRSVLGVVAPGRLAARRFPSFAVRAVMSRPVEKWGLVERPGLRA